MADVTWYMSESAEAAAEDLSRLLLSLEGRDDGEDAAEQYLDKFREIIDARLPEGPVVGMEEGIAVIQVAVEKFVQARQNFSAGQACMQWLASSLATLCAQYIVDLNYQYLPGEAKVQFVATLAMANELLQPFGHEDFLEVVLAARQPWPAVFLKLLKGQATDMSEVDVYLSREPSLLMEYRVRSLHAHGAVDDACTLAQYCMNHPSHRELLFFREMYLLCLWQAGKLKEIRRQVQFIECVQQYFIVQHFVAEGMLDMAATVSSCYLIYQWKKGEFCCNKELVRQWCQIQHAVDVSATAMLDSARSLAMKNEPKVLHLLYFAEALHSEVGKDSMPLVADLLLRAVDIDKPVTDPFFHPNAPDDKTGYHQSAPMILSYMAVLLEDDYEIRCASQLTSFSISPDLDQYHVVEAVTNLPEEVQGTGVNLSRHKRRDILKTLRKLRPRSCGLHPEMSWEQLKPHMLKLLSPEERDKLLQEHIEAEHDTSAFEEIGTSPAKVTVSKPRLPEKELVPKASEWDAEDQVVLLSDSEGSCGPISPIYSGARFGLDFATPPRPAKVSSIVDNVAKDSPFVGKEEVIICETSVRSPVNKDRWKQKGCKEEFTAAETVGQWDSETSRATGSVEDTLGSMAAGSMDKMVDTDDLMARIIKDQKEEARVSRDKVVTSNGCDKEGDEEGFSLQRDLGSSRHMHSKEQTARASVKKISKSLRHVTLNDLLWSTSPGDFAFSAGTDQEPVSSQSVTRSGEWEGPEGSMDVAEESMNLLCAEKLDLNGCEDNIPSEVARQGEMAELLPKYGETLREWEEHGRPGSIKKVEKVHSHNAEIMSHGTAEREKQRGSTESEDMMARNSMGDSLKIKMADWVDSMDMDNGGSCGSVLLVDLDNCNAPDNTIAAAELRMAAQHGHHKLQGSGREVGGARSGTSQQGVSPRKNIFEAIGSVTKSTKEQDGKSFLFPLYQSEREVPRTKGRPARLPTLQAVQRQLDFHDRSNNGPKLYGHDFMQSVARMQTLDPSVKDSRNSSASSLSSRDTTGSQEGYDGSSEYSADCGDGVGSGVQPRQGPTRKEKRRHGVRHFWTGFEFGQKDFTGGMEERDVHVSISKKKEKLLSELATSTLNNRSDSRDGRSPSSTKSSQLNRLRQILTEEKAVQQAGQATSTDQSSAMRWSEGRPQKVVHKTGNSTMSPLESERTVGVNTDDAHVADFEHLMSKTGSHSLSLLDSHSRISHVADSSLQGKHNCTQESTMEEQLLHIPRPLPASKKRRKNNIIRKGSMSIIKHDCFKCGHCVFQTRYYSSIKRHMTRHDNSRRYTKDVSFMCQHCDYSRSTVKEVLAHMTNMHQHDVQNNSLDTCSMDLPLAHVADAKFPTTLDSPVGREQLSYDNRSLPSTGKVFTHISDGSEADLNGSRSEVGTKKRKGKCPQNLSEIRKKTCAELAAKGIPHLQDTTPSRHKGIHQNVDSQSKAKESSWEAAGPGLMVQIPSRNVAATSAGGILTLRPTEQLPQTSFCNFTSGEDRFTTLLLQPARDAILTLQREMPQGSDSKSDGKISASASTREMPVFSHHSFSPPLRIPPMVSPPMMSAIVSPPVMSTMESLPTNVSPMARIPSKLSTMASPPAKLSPMASPPAKLSPMASPPAKLSPMASPPAKLSPMASPPAKLSPMASPPAKLSPMASPPAKLSPMASPPAKLSPMASLSKRLSSHVVRPPRSKDVNQNFAPSTTKTASKKEGKKDYKGTFLYNLLTDKDEVPGSGADASGESRYTESQSVVPPLCQQSAEVPMMQSIAPVPMLPHTMFAASIPNRYTPASTGPYLTEVMAPVGHRSVSSPHLVDNALVYGKDGGQFVSVDKKKHSRKGMSSNTSRKQDSSLVHAGTSPTILNIPQHGTYSPTFRPSPSQRKSSHRRWSDDQYSRYRSGLQNVKPFSELGEAAAQKEAYIAWSYSPASGRKPSHTTSKPPRAASSTGSGRAKTHMVATNEVQPLDLRMSPSTKSIPSAKSVWDKNCVGDGGNTGRHHLEQLQGQPVQTNSNPLSAINIQQVSSSLHEQSERYTSLRGDLQDHNTEGKRQTNDRQSLTVPYIPVHGDHAGSSDMTLKSTGKSAVTKGNSSSQSEELAIIVATFGKVKGDPAAGSLEKSVCHSVELPSREGNASGGEQHQHLTKSCDVINSTLPSSDINTEHLSVMGTQNDMFVSRNEDCPAEKSTTNATGESCHMSNALKIEKAKREDMMVSQVQNFDSESEQLPQVEQHNNPSLPETTGTASGDGDKVRKLESTSPSLQTAASQDEAGDILNATSTRADGEVVCKDSSTPETAWGDLDADPEADSKDELAVEPDTVKAAAGIAPVHTPSTTEVESSVPDVTAGRVSESEHVSDDDVTPLNTEIQSSVPDITSGRVSESEHVSDDDVTPLNTEIQSSVPDITSGRVSESEHLSDDDVSVADNKETAYSLTTKESLSVGDGREPAQNHDSGSSSEVQGTQSCHNSREGGLSEDRRIVTSTVHASADNHSVDQVKVEPDHPCSVEPVHACKTEPEQNYSVDLMHSCRDGVEHTSNVKPEHTCNAQLEHTCKPETEHTCKPEPEHTCNTEAVHTCKAEPEEDSVEPVHTCKPEAEHTCTPEPEHTCKPGPENSLKAEEEKICKAELEHSCKAESEHTNNVELVHNSKAVQPHRSSYTQAVAVSANVQLENGSSTDDKDVVKAEPSTDLVMNTRQDISHEKTNSSSDTLHQEEHSAAVNDSKLTIQKLDPTNVNDVPSLHHDGCQGRQSSHVEQTHTDSNSYKGPMTRKRSSTDSKQSSQQRKKSKMSRDETNTSVKPTEDNSKQQIPSITERPVKRRSTSQKSKEEPLVPSSSESKEAIKDLVVSTHEKFGQKGKVHRRPTRAMSVVKKKAASPTLPNKATETAAISLTSQQGEESVPGEQSAGFTLSTGVGAGTALPMSTRSDEGDMCSQTAKSSPHVTSLGTGAGDNKRKVRLTAKRLGRRTFDSPLTKQEPTMPTTEETKTPESRESDEPLQHTAVTPKEHKLTRKEKGFKRTKSKSVSKRKVGRSELSCTKEKLSAAGELASKSSDKDAPLQKFEETSSAESSKSVEPLENKEDLQSLAVPPQEMLIPKRNADRRQKMSRSLGRRHGAGTSKAPKEATDIVTAEELESTASVVASGVAQKTSLGRKVDSNRRVRRSVSQKGKDEPLLPCTYESVTFEPGKTKKSLPKSSSTTQENFGRNEDALTRQKQSGNGDERKPEDPLMPSSMEKLNFGTADQLHVANQTSEEDALVAQDKSPGTVHNKEKVGPSQGQPGRRRDARGLFVSEKSLSLAEDSTISQAMTGDMSFGKPSLILTQKKLGRREKTVKGQQNRRSVGRKKVKDPEESSLEKKSSVVHECEDPKKESSLQELQSSIPCEQSDGFHGSTGSIGVGTAHLAPTPSTNASSSEVTTLKPGKKSQVKSRPQFLGMQNSGKIAEAPRRSYRKKVPKVPGMPVVLYSKPRSHTDDGGTDSEVGDVSFKPPNSLWTYSREDKRKYQEQSTLTGKEESEGKSAEPELPVDPLSARSVEMVAQELLEGNITPVADDVKCDSDPCNRLVVEQDTTRQLRSRSPTSVTVTMATDETNTNSADPVSMDMVPSGLPSPSTEKPPATRWMRKRSVEDAPKTLLPDTTTSQMPAGTKGKTSKKTTKDLSSPPADGRKKFQQQTGPVPSSGGKGRNSQTSGTSRSVKRPTSGSSTRSARGKTKVKKREGKQEAAGRKGKSAGPARLVTKAKVSLRGSRPRK